MRIILIIVALFFVLPVISETCLAAEENQAEQPNIIVVFIDDMGYGDIGPFGSDTPTPHLDTLAKEGRRFTNFVVSSAVCSASRSAIMTGCYHRRVDIDGALYPGAKVALNPNEETVAEVCKKKGYATACFGKWHLGEKEPFLPTNQGFDEYLGLPYSNDMWPNHPTNKSFPPLPLIEATKEAGAKIIDSDVSAEKMKELTTMYTERAVAFIEKNKENPFFIYLPHTMVHVPIFVSDKFAGKSGKGVYGDVVMEIDWSIGEIVSALKRNGLDKKTLIVFTSDNGPWLSYGNHAGTAGPLREGKGTSFEGGIREPTIFWLPGQIPADTTCTELAATIDILPTVAKIIGADLPDKKIDGKDIRPLLFGETEGAETEKSPHTAYAIYYGGKLQAVRDTRWKLVFPHSHTSLSGREGGKDGQPAHYDIVKTDLALYDLRNDVGETTDVKDQYPEIVKRLSLAADEFRSDLGEGNVKGPGVRPAAVVE
ncbi:MAG: sulfatase family protein [Thermoguttaceae bacterium]